MRWIDASLVRRDWRAVQSRQPTHICELPAKEKKRAVVNLRHAGSRKWDLGPQATVSSNPAVPPTVRASPPLIITVKSAMKSRWSATP